MKKKLLTILLSVFMVLIVAPVSVFADGDGTYGNPWKIGTTGNESDVTAYFQDGTIYINGTGAMVDYEYMDTLPWYNYGTPITSVIIGEGITYIGKNAFCNYSSISNITIPSTVSEIGDRAFYCCSSSANIIVKATTPPSIGLQTFDMLSSLSINVPKESISAYKSATNWNYFSSGIEAITTIADVLNTADGGFPTIQSNAWTNENGKALYITNNSLTTAFGISDISSKVVNKDGNNYVYQDGSEKYEFIMNDGKLIKIIVSGFVYVEGRPEDYSKYNGEYDIYYAKINSTYYKTLDDAITAAEAGNTIMLRKDVVYKTNGTGLFNITKSITLDGDGHSISGYGTRSGNKTTLAINNSGSSMVDVTLKNLTINNNGSAGRPIETRGKITSLTLDNVTINATGGGNTQCLTVGGSQDTNASINIKGSTINAGGSGYPIVVFNPINLDIKDSGFTGYCGVYFKQPDTSAGSFGSVVNANNTSFDAPNIYNGYTNGFGVFVMCTDDIQINIDNCTVNSESTGTATQQVFYEDKSILYETKHNKYTVTGNETKIKGDIFDEEYHYDFSNRTWNIQAGYYNENPTEYLASGYKARALESTEEEYTEGYRYQVVLRTSNDDNKVVINTNEDVPKYYEEVANLQDAINNVNEVNQEKFDNNQTVTETVITVTNGDNRIEAEIDDKIEIIAKPVLDDSDNDINEVTAAPGYKLNDPIDAGNGNKSYTATALDIGYAKGDVAGSPTGSGIKDSKKTDTVLEAPSQEVSQGVKDSAESVNDTNANKQIEEIVYDDLADILSNKGINQGIAARILNKSGIVTVTNEGQGTDIAAKNINVFVLTYYETKVEEDKTTESNKSFALDVTPMYQAYASTASSKYTMKTEGTDKDSVKIGDSAPVDCTGKTITLEVQLPDGFITNTSQKVYVIHTLANGTTKTYNTTVKEQSGHFFVEFTNPDGFSKFEFTLDNPNKPQTDRYVAPKTGVR